MPDKTTSDAEWKAQLTPEEYEVLRKKGTERRGGEYDAFYPAPATGHFACRGCLKPLYSAAAKFKSGCGWPAFDRCYTGSIDTFEDTSHGMRRIEITCAGCGGHLGHVFLGERMTPTNERHCVNSVSVKFIQGEPPPGMAEDALLASK
jgi:peptide-methionine (R)-S-oxide reductase